MNDEPECTDYAVGRITWGPSAPVDASKGDPVTKRFDSRILRVDWDNLEWIPEKQAFRVIDPGKPAVTEEFE